MQFSAFSISSFSGIPLCKKLFENLFSKLNANEKIAINHCSIVGFANYSDSVTERPLKIFFNFDHFRNQSKIFKIIKYFQIAWRLVRFIHINNEPCIYTIDLNTCVLALFFRRFFKCKKVRVIYHQFEMDIPETLTRLNKLFFKKFLQCGKSLDLLIVPEMNRLKYILKYVPIPVDNTLIFPNTTNQYNFKKLLNSKVIFGHVGALGPNHYIDSLLKVFYKFESVADLLLIGRVDKELLKKISDYPAGNIRVIEQVSHDKLYDYYSKIDVGLILYRPNDLNNIYCAPNKLYEFLSCGIPVIAPQLEGLKNLFSNSLIGTLVDMDNLNELEQVIKSYFVKNYERRTSIQNYFSEQLSLSNHIELLSKKLSLL